MLGSLGQKLQDIYIHLQKHFITEEKMFDEGLSKLPKDHSVGGAHFLKTVEWELHKKQHNELLDNFKAISRRVVYHINETDQHHFHWTKK